VGAEARELLGRELYEAMMALNLAGRVYELLRILVPDPVLWNWDNQPESMRDDWRAVADVALKRLQLAELAYVLGSLEGLLRSLEPGFPLHAHIEQLVRMMRRALEHAGALRFEVPDE